MKNNNIQQFSFSDTQNVLVVTLWAWEEAIATVPNIPIELNDPWWLDGTFLISCIDKNGNLLSTVRGAECRVRPLFQMKTPLFTDLGTKICIEATKCTVISAQLALSDEVFDRMRFEDIDDYYKSDRFIKSLKGII